MNRLSRHPATGRAHPAVLVLLTAAAVAAGIAIFWMRAPALRIVEIPMLEHDDMPVAIAPAPDGSVWFSIDFANAIGHLRGGKIERVTKHSKNVDALGLAVDAQGNAWYADAPAAAILKVTPAHEVTATSLGTPIARLGRMAAAPDGAVWFAESTTYSVTRLRDGELKRFEIESERGGPFGVAVAQDGTAWATLQSANALLRIGTDGTMETLEIPTRGAGPSDIAVAADGTVWFLEFRTNRIGRYAAGQFSEVAIPEGIGALSGLTIAPDGSAWFGAMRGAALGHVEGGKVTMHKLPRDDAKPFSVAADAQGRIWYADIRGYIGRVESGR